MRRFLRVTLISCVVCLGGAAPASAQALPREVRIACLGDSITFGARVVDREHNAYPERLAHRVRDRLGPCAVVRNFGAGGRTLLRRGDTPYVACDAWRDALAWRPDVAVVVLGTNDTVSDPPRRNWEHEADLENDARALVVALREASAGVRVLLCSPPAMLPDAPGPDGAPLPGARQRDLRERATRLERIGAALRAVAAELDDVEFVDLSDVLALSHVVDGVHATPFGADALAARIDQALGFGPPRNPAVVPQPSAEYRSQPAGWGEDTWHDQLAKLRAIATEEPRPRLVFLGDSITQGLTGSADRRAHRGGLRPIDAAFGELGALALGLSGDRTEHLLYRIEHGALANCDPDTIVLQIGVNNVNAAGHTAAQTAEGIEAVVGLLERREPGARIILCGPFPCGVLPDDPRRAVIDGVHARIAHLDARERVTYLDLRLAFLAPDGRANDRLSTDGVHITRAGQEAWMAALTPLVGAH